MKMKKVYKIEDGKLLVGERPVDIRTDGGNCPFCDLPVYVSSGQLVKYFNNQPTHKQCRKRFA